MIIYSNHTTATFSLWIQINQRDKKLSTTSRPVQLEAKAEIKIVRGQGQRVLSSRSRTVVEDPCISIRITFDLLTSNSHTHGAKQSACRRGGQQTSDQSLVHSTRTELNLTAFCEREFANSSINSPVGIGLHASRTMQPGSLQCL